jgi:uncharacterized protein (TIGR03086 family)
MEGVALLQATVDELNRLIANVKPDQLENATPCTEWTVHDLLNHMIQGMTMFAISAEQGAIPDDVMGKLMGEDQVGEDYKGAVLAATTRAMKAFDQPGILEKMVTLPFGEMPAGTALNIGVFDIATHCCDLARATGQTIDNPKLLEAALAKGQGFVQPGYRIPGVFGPEIPADDSAPAEQRLMAFAGRKV